MDAALTYIAIVFAFIIGLIVGVVGLFLFRRVLFNRQMRIAERKAVKMVSVARNEAKEIMQDAQNEVKRNKTTTENEIRERRTEVQRQEKNLIQKTETLDRKLENVEQPSVLQALMK